MRLQNGKAGDSCTGTIRILADVLCRTSDVRHRIIPMLHMMSYVPGTRCRTSGTYDIIPVRHRMWCTYDIVYQCRTSGTYDTATYDVVRAYDIVCLTYDIVCHIVYDIVCLACTLYVLAYNIAHDIGYDIVCVVCDVHSIGFGAGFRGLNLHAL